VKVRSKSNYIYCVLARQGQYICHSQQLSHNITLSLMFYISDSLNNTPFHTLLKHVSCVLKLFGSFFPFSKLLFVNNITVSPVPIGFLFPFSHLIGGQFVFCVSIGYSISFHKNFVISKLAPSL